MEDVPRATFGEMTSARGRREVAPPDLIVWANAKDWHKKVECLLSEHLTATVKRRLRTSDPERFYDDDLEWLEEACGDDPLGCCIDEVLADSLLGFRVRTYHACRPRNVVEYLTLGLRCLRAEEARSELRSLVYRHDRLARLREEAAFAAALARVETEGRSARVFVGLDDRDLLEGAGHYLIYGSEYLSAVLVQAGGCYFQDVLKLEGIPTVFVIDSPISLMRRSDVRAFARLLLSQWGKNVVAGRKTAPPEDYSFDVRRDVPAGCIAGHYHPARIRDPLHQLEVYVCPAVSCPACVPLAVQTRRK